MMDRLVFITSQAREPIRETALWRCPLAVILDQFAHFRLALMHGKVILSQYPDWLRHAGQIEWRDAMKVDQTPFEYSRLEVNIVSVEVGNRFREAKSELKFFEAALGYVWTIVSLTKSFLAAAIRDGETAFPENGENEWYKVLQELVLDAELRERVARLARREVRWPYGLEPRNVLMTRLVSQLL